MDTARVVCFSVIFPSVGMRQGFLKSGLSSGKTQWQVASVSYNLSSHMVKEKTCKKIGDKNRKIKWVRGERSKAEANEGRGSFGTELGIGTSTVLFLP